LSLFVVTVYFSFSQFFAPSQLFDKPPFPSLFQSIRLCAQPLFSGPDHGVNSFAFVFVYIKMNPVYPLLSLQSHHVVHFLGARLGGTYKKK
jgi:hypothetical protein